MVRASTGSWFDRLTMREYLDAINAVAISVDASNKTPHPELVEGRIELMQSNVHDIGSTVVDLIRSIAKREVTFLSGAAAISRL